MTRLHIANTFFETELEGIKTCSAAEVLRKNPIYLQLQFLPFLYADEGDAILVSDLPDSNYLKNLSLYKLPTLECIRWDEQIKLKNYEVDSWGHSKIVAAWASALGIANSAPDWDTVKKVNSKQFSFLNSPQLPQAQLLFDRQETDKWLHETAGKKRVLKNCFGLSGRGHLFLPPEVSECEAKTALFLERQWAWRLPVIAEPWVDRVIDLSTQWVISRDKKIDYIGSTRCYNDENGQYRSNIVGDEGLLFGAFAPYLQEHKTASLCILQLMANMGFFGNVGIDAMLYRDFENQDLKLHPIVEINARKTMGWAALMFQKKHHPNECIEMQYRPNCEGYLPSVVYPQEKKAMKFHRNLLITKV